MAPANSDGDSLAAQHELKKVKKRVTLCEAGRLAPRGWCFRFARPISSHFNGRMPGLFVCASRVAGRHVFFPHGRPDGRP